MNTQFIFFIVLFYCVSLFTKPDVYFSGKYTNQLMPSFIAFSSEALSLIKENRLIGYYQKTYDDFKKELKLFPTIKEKQELSRLEKIVNLCKIIEPYMLWHQKVPTVGLLSDNKKLMYPFLPHAFLLHELAPSCGKAITIVLLDYPLPEKIIEHNAVFKKHPQVTLSSYRKSHSLHSVGIIKSFASHANVHVLSIFDKNLKSWPSLLSTGLKDAVCMNADIVNLSLKLTDYLDPLSDTFNTIQLYLNIIPYTVAASGNSDNKNDKSIEAYPARFDAITFDVGSFGYDALKKEYPVSFFSQHEKSIGPKFLMPGEYILSNSIIDNQKEDDFYSVMSGTSMAAPLMTGFTALMLAEFQSDFSREELLTTCYYSTVRMHATTDWQEKSLLGTLDMRLTLFTLHCIRAFKQSLNKDDILLHKYSFNALLAIVHEILFDITNTYTKNSSITYTYTQFKNSFADFYNTYEQHQEGILPDFFNNLDAAINKVVVLVKEKINKRNSKLLLKNAHLASLPDKINRVFTVSNQSSTLFVNNSKAYFTIKNNVKSEMNDLVQKTEPLRNYWKKQLNWSKRRSW